MNQITKKLCNGRRASFFSSFDNIPNIVVLLILAGITITMIVSDDGIIKYAEKAANSANQSQKDTLEGLKNIADQLTKPYTDNSTNSSGSIGGEGDCLIDKYKTPIDASDVQLFGRDVNYHVPSTTVASQIGNEDQWVLLYKGRSFSETRRRRNLSYYEKRNCCSIWTGGCG